ncbi:hypothetical protein CTAYLR_008069 [Chrysophaeum taylorii]|uniref:FAD/NAD(P)-binding domain-containing protein n=1 Tax=Chrysophaeum taylorii TaxID=2483200 RepID=A0AAD7ULE8_9STRA|nr:hypothetical protein CTAYLR_008069 [Chrysophaeum taylorii]
MVAPQPTRVCVARDEVVVVGGGFAGLYTALKLAGRNRRRRVRLIDSRERFCFLPLLYEYACGEMGIEEVSVPFELALRGTGIAFERAEVSSLDLDSKEVSLKDGRILRGEALVIALGKETVAPPGTVPFYRLEDATRVRAAKDWRKIAVVGGGYTGVELACHLGTLGREVTLVHRGSTLVPLAQNRTREVATEALRRSNVRVRLGAGVSEVRDDGAVALDSEVIIDGLDAVVWTAGSRLAGPVRDLDRRFKRRLEDDGPLGVDAALRVRACDGVFALGDAAATPGPRLSPSAQTALQQADVAAANLDAYLDGLEPVKNFNYLQLGELVSFAPDDAAAAILPGFLDGLAVLDGPVASLARRLVYAARMPTPNQRLVSFAGLAISEATKRRGPPPPPLFF